MNALVLDFGCREHMLLLFWCCSLQTQAQSAAQNMSDSTDPLAVAARRKGRGRGYLGGFLLDRAHHAITASMHEAALHMLRPRNRQAMNAAVQLHLGTVSFHCKLAKIAVRGSGPLHRRPQLRGKVR